MGVDGAAQIVRDPLTHVGSEVFFGVGAQRIRNGNDQDGDAGEDENIARRRTCGGADEMVQPTVMVLALQQVVENDLQGPGFEQAGDAFPCDGEQSKPQLATVRPQQFENA